MVSAGGAAGWVAAGGGAAAVTVTARRAAASTLTGTKAGFGAALADWVAVTAAFCVTWPDGCHHLLSQ